MELTAEHYRLAESAYNGYCKQTGWKSLATGDNLPPFENLKPQIRDAWCAAAIAISLDIDMRSRRTDAPSSFVSQEAKL